MRDEGQWNGGKKSLETLLIKRRILYTLRFVKHVSLMRLLTKNNEIVVK